MRIVEPGAWLRTLQRPRSDVRLVKVYRGAFRHRRTQVGLTKRDPRHILMLVERGSLYMELEGKPYHVLPGQALWIPPNTYRHVRARGPGERSLDYRIHFEVHERGSPCAFTRKPLLRNDAWDLPALAKLLLDVLRRPRTHADALVRGLLVALACEFLNLPSRAHKLGAVFTPSERARLTQCMDQKLGAAPTVRDLAQSLGLSTDYFSRKFQASYGQAPREFIKRERMQGMAEQLTETAVSFKELCYRFRIDKSQAVRQFRKMYGCTPTQYRRRGRH